jgi:hypothetical protein
MVIVGGVVAWTRSTLDSWTKCSGGKVDLMTERKCSEDNVLNRGNEILAIDPNGVDRSAENLDALDGELHLCAMKRNL